MDVLTSMGINFKLNRSNRSRNGILILAFPITVFLLKPEIINAISGGAFTYPDIRIPRMPAIRIIAIIVENKLIFVIFFPPSFGVI